jgi:NADH:ubiquinone oxidoreductase subunit C
MKSKEPVHQQVKDTFKVLESIKEVKVNHFFKHNVLQQLKNQKEETTSILDWFTPRLQLASVAFVLLLNASALFYAFSSQEQNFVVNIDSFSQEYSLQSDTIYLLN